MAVLNNCAAIARWCLPVTCALCAEETRCERLCARCAAQLPRLPRSRCGVCALPLASGAICGACLDHAPHYDAISAVYAYAFPLDALIAGFKYRGDLSLAPVLAAALGAEIAAGDGPAVDVIVPMPLSPARLKHRGFNQAQELARLVGRACSRPVLARACRKVTDTPPQAALPWKARARNVRGAFVCDVDLNDQRVAIVDDVMTTGATLNELARNLKRAGAAAVHGWVVARTLRD